MILSVPDGLDDNDNDNLMAKFPSLFYDSSTIILSVSSLLYKRGTAVIFTCSPAATGANPVTATVGATIA